MGGPVENADGLLHSEPPNTSNPFSALSSNSMEHLHVSSPYQRVDRLSDSPLGSQDDITLNPSTMTVNEVMSKKDHVLPSQSSPAESPFPRDPPKRPSAIRYAQASSYSGPPSRRGSHSESTPPLYSREPSFATTDDEYSDDYDWSGEDDLEDEEAKFEERMGGVKTQKKGWGFKRIITSLYSTFIGSTFLAAILVTPAVLVQIFWYKPHPTPERLFVKDNVQAWLFWAASNIVVSWGLAMAIDIVPVFALYFIAASWGHVSEYVKNRVETYDSVKNTIKPLFYAASGWISWIIIFGQIYDLYNPGDEKNSRASYTGWLQNVIQFFFFLVLVLCVKQMLCHFIAFSFHRTAYQERIDIVREALDVVETLRTYRPKTRKSQSNWTFPSADKEYPKSLIHTLQTIIPTGVRRKTYPHDSADDADTENDRGLSPGTSTIGATVKGKTKEIQKGWYHPSPSEYSPSLSHPEQGVELYPLKSDAGNSTPPDQCPLGERLPPLGNADHCEDRTTKGLRLMQAARVIKNAALHDARNIKGKNYGEGSLAYNVSSSHEAKRLARAVYMRLKDRGRHYLVPSDFYPAFPDKVAAQAAFRIFDEDNHGDVSRAEIKHTLVKVYKERRFLSRSMRDVGAALKTLDRLLLALSMVVLFFISISVFGLDIGKSLTSIYSLGIAASFIFKNAASSAFDSIMFLFVAHPYDTGDRCFIDDDNLVVKRVGLFATVFTRADGTETYYFNSQLFTKFITNVRRSDKTFESATLQVAWRTSLEQLDTLEECLNEWLSTEENRWFEPTTSVTLQNIHFQRYLTITISIGHNSNWQVCFADWGLRTQRKTVFHAAILYYCRHLGITYYESPIPVIYGDPIDSKKASHKPMSLGSHREESNFTLTRPWAAGESSQGKTYLGFVPPEEPALRARRSKSKKVAMLIGNL